MRRWCRNTTPTPTPSGGVSITVIMRWIRIMRTKYSGNRLRILICRRLQYLSRRYCNRRNSRFCSWLRAMMKRWCRGGPVIIIKKVSIRTLRAWIRMMRRKYSGNHLRILVCRRLQSLNRRYCSRRNKRFCRVLRRLTRRWCRRRTGSVSGGVSIRKIMMWMRNIRKRFSGQQLRSITCRRLKLVYGRHCRRKNTALCRWIRRMIKKWCVRR